MNVEGISHNFDCTRLPCRGGYPKSKLLATTLDDSRFLNCILSISSKRSLESVSVLLGQSHITADRKCATGSTTALVEPAEHADAHKHRKPIRQQFLQSFRVRNPKDLPRKTDPFCRFGSWTVDYTVDHDMRVKPTDIPSENSHNFRFDDVEKERLTTTVSRSYQIKATPPLHTFEDRLRS